MKATFATLLILCILACTGEDGRLMHEALMQAKAQLCHDTDLLYTF